MNERTTSEHLRGYYRAQALNAASLGRLIRAAQSGLGSEFPKAAARWRGMGSGRGWSRRVAAGAAVALAAALVAAVFFDGIPGLGLFQGRPEALRGAIVREVALNHGKRLEVEFAASSFAGLRARMDELNFVVRRPARLPGESFRLVGGRYCSIQGRLAAQIKLEDERGRALTLYQTRFVRDFEGVDGVKQSWEGGLSVELWREDGMLQGLARPSAEGS